MMQKTTSLQCKGQKTSGLGSGVEVFLETTGGKQCTQNSTSQWISRRELVAGLSFTMVCIPKGMHGHPRVRDNYMAAVTR